MRNTTLRMHEDERGIAMIFAVILVGLAGLISVALLTLVQNENTHSRTAVVQNGAYQAAEAGIDAYIGKILQNSAYPLQYMAAGESSRKISGTTYTGSPSSDVTLPYPTSSWGYTSKDVWVASSKLNSGYQYNLEICLPSQSCSGFTGTDKYTRILSTGRPVSSTDKNTWRAIEVELRPKSISDFQMLANASITYGSGATTYGEVYVVSDPNCGKSGYPSCHTLTHNGTAYGNLYSDYQISGSPTMMSGAKRYDVDSTPYTIRQVISQPPSFTALVSSIGDVQTAAQNGGLYLDLGSQYGSPPSGYEAWQLVFKSNGTVDVSKCKKTYSSSAKAYQNVWHLAPTCDPPVNYTLPANGAIYSPQTILVEGVVAGKVTVCSGGSSSSSVGNVVVSGNISYQTEGSNVLGLIAKNNVIVGNQVPSTLTWRGATLSQTGQWVSDPDGGSYHSTMTFSGSTATAAGGSMGEFGTRNYLYDDTLRFLPPPLWPSVGSSYQIVIEREVSP
jgi:Tfp pilus assembly protein PilX